MLARPADTWAHRDIDFVSPDDDEIEAVLAHVSVERRNRLICLDHLVTDRDDGRDAFMLGLGVISAKASRPRSATSSTTWSAVSTCE
jgi:hypothetical protein